MLKKKKKKKEQCFTCFHFFWILCDSSHLSKCLSLQKLFYFNLFHSQSSTITSRTLYFEASLFIIFLYLISLIAYNFVYMEPNLLLFFLIISNETVTKSRNHKKTDNSIQHLNFYVTNRSFKHLMEIQHHNWVEQAYAINWSL